MGEYWLVSDSEELTSFCKGDFENTSLYFSLSSNRLKEALKGLKYDYFEKDFRVLPWSLLE